MIKVLFICHGNICRSPVGEILLKNKIKENHLENKIKVFSRATSFEEIGNDIYPPMKRVLTSHGISFNRRALRRHRQNGDGNIPKTGFWTGSWGRGYPDLCVETKKGEWMFKLLKKRSKKSETWRETTADCLFSRRFQKGQVGRCRS